VKRTAPGRPAPPGGAPRGSRAAALAAVGQPLNLAAWIPGYSGGSAREPDAAEAAGSAAPIRRPCTHGKGGAGCLSPPGFEPERPWLSSKLRGDF
jgi:hypothetical protein